MWFDDDDDDDDDEYVGGEKTEGRNLNWKIPAASLVIPRSEKGEHHFEEKNLTNKQKTSFSGDLFSWRKRSLYLESEPITYRDQDQDLFLW